MILDFRLVSDLNVEKNTYRLCTSDPGMAALLHLPPVPIITFTPTDPNLPLPNPEYLKLHATVCPVAHISGAADYLGFEVLVHDGSSANLFSFST